MSEGGKSDRTQKAGFKNGPPPQLPIRRSPLSGDPFLFLFFFLERFFLGFVAGYVFNPDVGSSYGKTVLSHQLQVSFLETLSPAAARDSPASEPSSPRLRFPAGERVSRELLSEGGGSLRRPHQHPSPALLQ